MHLLRRGTTRAGDERYLVPALMRGLQVLQSLSGETRRLSLSELAEAIGVTRSSAYRLVYTLDHLGFLKSDAQTKTYTLGTAGASDRLRLSEVARSRGG
ncbi:MAG: helix-turn-helix domain-containing protein [Bradyrhizobium sp.]